MNNIKSFLAQGIDTLTISFIVVDVILVVAAIAFLIWLYVKTSQVKVRKNNKDLGVKKIDDETYVIPSEMINPDENSKISGKEYAPEHLANQISGLKESDSQTSNAVVKKDLTENEYSGFKKEEIGNVVVIEGKNKTSPKTSVNRGASAYQNSTNFIDAIKSETEPVKKKSATKRKSSTKK